MAPSIPFRQDIPDTRPDECAIDSAAGMAQTFALQLLWPVSRPGVQSQLAS